MKNFSAKNSAIFSPINSEEPHAYATYAVLKSEHGPEIFEEIAIGQSLGAWDERFVDPHTLQTKVAKIIQTSEDATHLRATIAFPFQLWHGQLSWLLTLVFGKMSFYRAVCFENLSFDERCFAANTLSGPSLSMRELRTRVGAPAQRPLLMGILKPNVAMSATSLTELYTEVANAGVHLVKDDEIRHDAHFEETLERIEAVANVKAKNNLKTLYVAHAPWNLASIANLKSWCERLENAGADALLVNVWTSGLNTLQSLRMATRLPLVAHPALAGALGQGLSGDSICPSVTLGSLTRAAGADLTLFPSPYGKIGLPKATTLKISEACSAPWNETILPTIPVPSAGIKPEHVPLACNDFGRDFILNAGTAIFASGRSVSESAKDFLTRMENFCDAR